VEQKFTKLILKTFGSKRIISFLYFGTRAFVGACNESDYDFMLILDKYNSSDIFTLRKICQSSQFKSLDLNVNFLYLSDIKVKRKENFQLRSLRLDFYKYLENAIVLIGKNIFSKVPVKLSRNKIRDLMDFKIQEHYGRCDKLFTQNLGDKSLYENIRKYVKGIIRFILIKENIMTFGDITKYTFEEIFDLAAKNKIFPTPTVAKFSVLLKDYSGRKSLENLDNLRRLVYEKYLNLYSKK
jgi:hypothetical protein